MADVLNPHNEASSSEISSNSESCQLSSESSTPKSSTNRVRKNITDYFDRQNENEGENINKALARFSFGCNLPFSIVESQIFKSFMKTLQPAYAGLIPKFCRK